jgi:hypothetical protein
MSFRFVKFYALFLAGLLPVGCLVAQTNSAPAEQPIIFSSPDGEIVSNALLPSAEAPAPSPFADMPSEIPDSIAYPGMPVRRLPRPPRMPIQRNNTQSLLDEDQTGLSTPSQIMGIPTLQDIFGLPKPYATYDRKNGKDKDNSSPQGTQTNSISSEDANWARILSGDTDQSAFAPDKPKSPRVSTGFFDNTPTDVSDKSLKDKYQEQDDSVFGSSPFGQNPAEQAAFNPSTQSSEETTPAPAPASVFSPGAPSFNSAFSPVVSSQSPFALPTSSSLGTLPQPPSLPVSAFQNNVSPPPAVPSWMPKPAPWLSQMPQLGTMEQRKF